MNSLRNKLGAVVKFIDRLGAAARRELVPKPTLSKRVPLFESVAFVIPLSEGGMAVPDSFKTLEQYWTNGADDAYITEVCHSSFGILTIAAPNGGPRLLYDSEQGLFSFDTYRSSPFQGGPVFDFEWNFRMGVSGQLYGNSATGDRYLSRKSLGNKYQDRPLRFTDPLFVKAGDSLVWMLKPTMFNPGAVGLAPPMTGTAGLPANNFQAIVVNMLMWGYRDGTMARAEYALKNEDLDDLTDTERA